MIHERRLPHFQAWDGRPASHRITGAGQRSDASAHRPGARWRWRAWRGAHRRARSAGKAACAGRLHRGNQHGRAGCRRLRRRTPSRQDAQRTGAGRLERHVPGQPDLFRDQLPQQGDFDALHAWLGNGRRRKGRRLSARRGGRTEDQAVLQPAGGFRPGRAQHRVAALAAVDRRHRYRQRRQGGLPRGQPDERHAREHVGSRTDGAGRASGAQAGRWRTGR